jgi:hypothetical protein
LSVGESKMKAAIEAASKWVEMTGTHSDPSSVSSVTAYV